MTGLGLTKYGFGVTYSVDGDTKVNRTYNGLNFASDSATAKARQLSAFVNGSYLDDDEQTITLPGSIRGIVNALGMQGIDSFELIQRNTVTSDA